MHNRMTTGLTRKITHADLNTHKDTIALETKILDGNKPPEKKEDETLKDQTPKETKNESEKDSTEEKEKTSTELDSTDVEPKNSDVKEASSEKDETDADEDSHAEESEAERSKRKSRNQKRIERLSKRNAELSGQLSQALNYIQESKNPEANAESKNDDPKPKRENFDDPDAYDTALIEWSANKTQKKLEDSERKKTLEAQAQKVREAWQEKIDLGNDKYDDFDDVVLSDALPISMAMSQAIISLENGEDVAYYLGKNPEIAKKIAALEGVQAGIELSKISAKLETPVKEVKEDEEQARVKAEEEKAKKKISKAPEPHKPATSKRSSDVIDLDNETPEQYRLRRLKEMKYSSLKPILKLK